MNWERQYKIAHTHLWYIIYRKRTVGKLMRLEFLNSDGSWVLSKDSARVFYNQSDAISVLTIVRCKWDKEETDITSEKKSDSEDKVEKQSWSEF